MSSLILVHVLKAFVRPGKGEKFLSLAIVFKTGLNLKSGGIWLNGALIFF